MSNLVWNTIDAEYGTFDWLRRELCVKIGYNADHRLLNRSERSYVDSIIESGINQFCNASYPSSVMLPEPPAGEGRVDQPLISDAEKEFKRKPPHNWSFLHKVHDISTIVGESNYEMPEDFGAWIGEPTTTRAGGKIAIARENHIRQLHGIEQEKRRVERARLLADVYDVATEQQLNAEDKAEFNAALLALSAGKPKYCATRKSSIGGTSKQTTELILYPTPDAIETIQVEYKAIPPALGDQSQYPAGGTEHAETVLASCFYVCALRMGQGIEQAVVHLRDRMTASIIIDRASAKPTTDGVWIDDDGRFNAAYLSRMVGRHIGAGPNPSAWTHQQEQMIAEALRRAKRKVFNPPLVMGERYPHDWSFLRPVGTIETKAGVYAYDLPSDFAQMYGQLTHSTQGSTLYPCINFIGEHIIRQLLQRQETSARPDRAAVRVKPKGDTTPTTYELLLWPVPDDSYTIDFRYRVNPDTSEANSLPALVDSMDLHGGDRFSEMYLEAAFLSADEIMGVKRSVHEERFLRAVMNAVGSDRLTAAPDSMGYNGDPSSRRMWTGDWHEYDENVVTYNGSMY